MLIAQGGRRADRSLLHLLRGGELLPTLDYVTTHDLLRLKLDRVCLGLHELRWEQVIMRIKGGQTNIWFWIWA